MIADFERRFADVLGARLPAPLQGSVDQAPGRDDAQIVVSVRQVVPVEEDLFALRPELVPGATDRRRVTRLRCEVRLEVRLLEGQTRTDWMRAIDQTIYTLDDPVFRSGRVLDPTDNSDPGFFIRSLGLTSAEPPVAITLRAEGFFWPPNTPGQTGVAINQARIRIAIEPMRLTPAQPRLIAGGEALELAVEFGALGTSRVERDRVTGLPFGSVVVTVVDAGGRPGAGTLAGGIDGAGGARVIPVDQGRATLQYTPPAQPALDQLVVALDDGEGGAGIEIGRFPLEVRGA